MADAQKVIELIFQGVDKTGAATQSALENAQKFSGSIQGVTQPIADFTAGALKLEAGLLAAGAAIVAFSVKSASDFDSAFRQISTIIDASDEDLAGFKQAILDYAGTSTQPLEQITNALGAAIGSGVDWAQSLDLISTAEKLAVSTRSDLDSTTKVLVSTLNSYGMNISDAGKVSDLFFKIIDEGDISMTDLANSFAKVAPIAKISGVSLEEVGAAIATLTASGIKPAESIEYLRGAISNIISPTKQAQDLSAELGIQFNAAGLKANGLAGLLQLVAEKTGGSADKMKILFGDIGGFTAAATLAGPQAQKFTENVAAMGNAAGATDEAFKKVIGSVENSTKIVANSLKALTTEIGTPLLDEFGGIANAIAKIFQVLGANVKDGALTDLVKYVEKNMAALEATIETVAKNLPAALKNADFSGFKGGIESVLNAFKLLFNNIDLTTVNGLTRAIELAGIAFLGLSKFTAGVIESFKPLFDKLVEIGGSVDKFNPEILKLAGNFAGFATQANALAGAIGGLLPMLNGLVNLIVANQGISLVTGIANLAAAIPALTVSLGPAGMAVAVAATTYVIGNLIVELYKLYDLKNKLSENKQFLGEKEAEALAKLNASTGMAFKSLTEFNAAANSGVIVYDKATLTWVKASQAIDNVSESTRKNAGAAADAQNAMRKMDAAYAGAADSTAKLGQSQDKTWDKVAGVKPIFDALTGAIIGYEQVATKASTAVDKNSASLDKNGEKAEKARQEAEKLAIEWEKIASNERIKTMEAVVKLDIANMEEGTKRFQASLDSVNKVIEITSKSINDMFKIYADGASTLTFSQLQKIEDQIAKENAVRDKELNLQEKLINAQVDQMRAQTDAMRNGQGLIKIDGAGLKPHLEAFMWEILKAIQVRTNKDGLKLLLGV